MLQIAGPALVLPVTLDLSPNSLARRASFDDVAI